MSMLSSFWSITTRKQLRKPYNAYSKLNRSVHVRLFQDGTILGKYNTFQSKFLFSALADVLYIYPFKSDKKTFDQDKDELGFATKTKVTKKKKTAEDIEREREEYLEEERLKIEEEVGLIEEKQNIDVNRITN